MGGAAAFRLARNIHSPSWPIMHNIQVRSSLWTPIKTKLISLTIGQACSFGACRYSEAAAVSGCLQLSIKRVMTTNRKCHPCQFLQMSLAWKCPTSPTAAKKTADVAEDKQWRHESGLSTDDNPISLLNRVISIDFNSGRLSWVEIALILTLLIAVHFGGDFFRYTDTQTVRS